MYSAGKLTLKDLPEHEQLVSCPYNKAHQVVASRMAKHLVKCRRSHSTKGTKVCRFNTSHVHALEEIDEHEDNCPDRFLVELYNELKKPLKQEEKPAMKSASAHAMVKSNSHIHDEDWDNEFTASYNPYEATKDRPILRHVQHRLPSEMKKLREENRLRNRSILNDIDSWVSEENEKRRTEMSLALLKLEEEDGDERMAPLKRPAKDSKPMDKRAALNPSINWNYAEKNYSH